MEANIGTITGYRSTLDSFTVRDEQGNTISLDFSEVETWYKRAKERREAEEKKFEREWRKEQRSK